MQPRDEQALIAAKLYYRAGLSQAAVAREMGVSRPTASKLIQHAHDRGFVTITINDPRESASEMANALAEKYGLTEVRLAQPTTPSADNILAALGRVSAQLLSELVKDNMSIGVSWGQTMYALARSLPEKAVSGVQIVQLKGGMSYTSRKTNDIETINLFCKAFHAYAHVLPLPVIFDSPETKRLVEKDRFIAQVLNDGRNTDIAVFTVGSASPDSLALNLGSITEAERAELLDKAVGDVCSRFYDEHAHTAVPSVDDRTVGITIADLHSRPTRLLVAGGLRKARAIRVALEAGLATHLVIDQDCAERILEDSAD